MKDPKEYTPREAVAAIYIPSSPDLQPRTVRKLKHELNLWERLTSNPSIGTIAMKDFVEFRTKGVKAGLSAAYIECIVSDVTTILKSCCYAGVLEGIPMVGKRLKRPYRLKPAPTVEELAAAYQHVEVAEWPVNQRWNRIHDDKSGRFTPSGCRTNLTVVWWQGVLAGLYFTGFRKSDLLCLTWDEVKTDRIVRRMRKTGFDIAIPIHPVLRVHLDRLPRNGSLVFGRYGCDKQIRQNLNWITTAAQCGAFSFQSVRRLAGQSWHKASPGCGGLILGHGFRGADRAYLDPYQALRSALPALEVPEPMKTDDTPILETLRTINPDERLKLLRAAAADLTADLGAAT